LGGGGSRSLQQLYSEEQTIAAANKPYSRQIPLMDAHINSRVHFFNTFPNQASVKPTHQFNRQLVTLLRSLHFDAFGPMMGGNHDESNVARRPTKAFSFIAPVTFGFLPYRSLQTVIKAGNADRGSVNELNFYFLCPALNIQQNLKYHQQIYHHRITLHSV
jgi:hypothetical protein